jgi:methionine-rich copper-binding protein CopC
MRVIAARSLLAALMVVISGAFFTPASAAPTKTSSNPSDGEQLHQAPERVSITFDQPLDPGSRIEVTNHCDERVDEQPTQIDGTEMSVAVTGTSAGMYHVTYVARGLAGVTGESTGAFTFSVHMGGSCDGGGGGHHHGSGSGGHQGSEGGHGGEEGHTSAGHEGAAHRSTTHASTTHASSHSSPSHTSHSSTGMDHGDHAMSSESSSHGEHAGHSAAGDERGATDHISSAPTNSPVRGPGSEAVVMSLSLCALLGVAGGVVLRASAPN